MKKKLSVKVIMSLILSAVLFCMPIGAFMANSGNTVSVQAQDTDAEENESETETPSTGNEEESESEQESSTVSGNDIPTPECACKEKCSQYSVDKECEVCKEDYQDTVEDREAQVANITEDIRNGNTGYLNDFLNAVISEGVREGITDIFGEGVEIDDSEAVQTARRAKELLDKLAEYKPLAKVEELEEQNYNMIDNVLNNGAEKKEQEQIKGRISIKEKLAEKKAVIEQRDKAERTSPEKETEKKSQREM